MKKSPRGKNPDQTSPPMFGKASSFSGEMLEKWHRQATSSLGLMTAEQKIIVRGYDVLKSLLPNVNLGQILHLFIRKILPNPQKARVLDALVIALNYPDIRIWPIGSVAYAGAAGASCGAAISAGFLGLEASAFGANAVLHASDFLQDCLAAEKKKKLKLFLEQLISQKKKALGYGRPIFKTDERVPAVIETLKGQGIPQGKWLKLALTVEKMLLAAKQLRLNYGGLMAALLMDLDFSRNEIQAFAIFPPVVNFLGVFLEHQNSTTPIFPLACDDIEYSGISPKGAVHESK